MFIVHRWSQLPLVTAAIHGNLRCTPRSKVLVFWECPQILKVYYECLLLGGSPARIWSMGSWIIWTINPTDFLLNSRLSDSSGFHISSASKPAAFSNMVMRTVHFVPSFFQLHDSFPEDFAMIFPATMTSISGFSNISPILPEISPLLKPLGTYLPHTYQPFGCKFQTFARIFVPESPNLWVFQFFFRQATPMIPWSFGCLQRRAPVRRAPASAAAAPVRRIVKLGTSRNRGLNGFTPGEHGGVSRKGGYPRSGWFISWKFPHGWFGGTTFT